MRETQTTSKQTKNVIKKLNRIVNKMKVAKIMESQKVDIHANHADVRQSASKLNRQDPSTPRQELSITWSNQQLLVESSSNFQRTSCLNHQTSKNYMYLTKTSRQAYRKQSGMQLSNTCSQFTSKVCSYAGQNSYKASQKAVKIQTYS